MNKKKQFEVALDSLEKVAEQIIKLFPHGAVIGLSGELGSGKTTLVRAIIQLIAERQGLKIGRVISPSFVLHQSYEFLKPPIHHFDLYRMNKVDESMLVELEYYEILAKTQKQEGFVFVEWPEMCIEKSILKLTSQINISILDTKRRYHIDD